MQAITCMSSPCPHNDACKECTEPEGTGKAVVGWHFGSPFEIGKPQDCGAADQHVVRETLLIRGGCRCFRHSFAPTQRKGPSTTKNTLYLIIRYAHVGKRR